MSTTQVIDMLHFGIARESYGHPIILSVAVPYGSKKRQLDELLSPHETLGLISTFTRAAKGNEDSFIKFTSCAARIKVTPAQAITMAQQLMSVITTGDLDALY